ncbi:MAG TPA: hypothetical protein VK772_14415 [Puia sp.]|nr:hypothetical protein [Puia sp.]
MRSILLTVAIVLIGLTGHAQTKTASAKKTGMLTAEGAEFVLTAAADGKYLFSYRNTMGRSKDTSTIVFRNKNEAGDFIHKIGNAFAAKDGTSFYIVYPNYKIRLLTEMNVVFMIVNETGKAQSTFRITKENYSEVNVL